MGKFNRKKTVDERGLHCDKWSNSIGGKRKKYCFMGGKHRCLHGMMKAQDAAALAERIDAQLVFLFYYGVLPGYVPPEEPGKLLKKQNRPYFSPAYEENFVL